MNDDLKLDIYETVRDMYNANRAQNFTSTIDNIGKQSADEQTFLLMIKDFVETLKDLRVLPYDHQREEDFYGQYEAICHYLATLPKPALEQGTQGIEQLIKSS